MAQENTQETLGETPNSDSPSFIDSNTTRTGKVDSVYSDFFQETSDGKISVGAKAKKSGLEIYTTLMGYIIPITLLAVIAGSAHVFLRTKVSGSTIENYPFLCSYINNGVNLEVNERGCNALSAIQANYTEKQSLLTNEITKKLNEYIPIKITKNLMSTSPEKKFIIQAYNSKIDPGVIMQQFETIIEASQYTSAENIKCTGINISREGVLSTQCTIKGMGIGDDDSNGRLGSSRIETLNFLDALGDTTRSHFILMNPPTSLSTEEVKGGEEEFKTSTTVPIQVKYTSINQLP